MKRQSDGFSLIEVIIAIAVLAIVAVSLLSYFSSAGSYANWGRSTQKADMAAQSVVEELASCTTFDQIENQLVASGSAISGSAWKVISTPGPADNTCRLSRDVAVDSTAYTARVTVDFDKYKSTTPAAPTTTPLSKFNDYEMPQLEKVYSENNVVLEETDETEAAVGDIFSKIYPTDKTITKTTIREGLNRTLAINLSSYSADLYLVKGYYKYEYGTYSCEMPLKSVKIEKDLLQKVYLFYRPVNDTLALEQLDITADSSLPAGFQLEDFSFYAVLQKEAVNPPANYHLDIISGGNPAPVGLKNKVYSNANQLPGSSDNFISHKAENRIAMITVDVYFADETAFNEENRLVSLQTSKGA